MKVILLGELRGKGGEGDVVDVAQGFAENYLYPQRIAIPATKGNLKQLEERRHNIAKREEKRLADAAALKATLELEGGMAADCVGCNQCVDVCPQGIDTPAILAEIAEKLA